MMHRISTTWVTFRSPFRLDSTDGEWPAGTYAVEASDESISSLSFQAFRRVHTRMIALGRRGWSGLPRPVEIVPSELAAALATDRDGLDRAEDEGMTAS
ncbi:hypothetical protein [Maricaulis sp.]|uniref:hypothetical protein n=1 Tax=Maricaulis sp. TaxID=1486257 RepID=UPI0032987F08